MTVSTIHHRIGSGPKQKLWDQLVAEQTAAGLTFAEAVSRVDSENPGLRQAMLTEVNTNRIRNDRRFA